MMEPHTATNLKERKENKLKDFVHVAGPLGTAGARSRRPPPPHTLAPGVSHFLLLSATERARYLRIAKSPRGPTLTWRVAAYAHTSDVAASHARPRAPESAFRTPPLVVLNNFGSEPHMKLAALTFQNLFPALNVHSVKLASLQRVLLVDYDAPSRRFRLRHYAIAARRSGVNRRLRRLLTERTVPDLGGCTDVADFLTRAGATDGSDSEGEDGAAARVTLAQGVRGPGNTAGATSRLRLQELGPRLDLELLKVEDGLCAGGVLFHEHVAKSEEQAAALEGAARERAALKASRRAAQEANVERKAEEAAAREARRAAAREERRRRKEGGAPDEQEEEEDEEEADDDLDMDAEPAPAPKRRRADPKPHEKAKS
jgi:ribosome biogenesis protein SSF1/2